VLSRRALWNIERRRDTATLVIEQFARPSKRDTSAAADATTHDVRFITAG
jgi:hypothetical protein